MTIAWRIVLERKLRVFLVNKMIQSDDDRRESISIYSEVVSVRAVTFLLDAFRH